MLREAAAAPKVLRDWRKQDVETRTVHLLEITVKHPLMMELARSPRILKRVTPLIGPDIQFQHSKLATKPATKGSGRLSTGIRTSPSFPIPTAICWR